jgi:hypothetical protein
LSGAGGGATGVAGAGAGLDVEEAQAPTAADSAAARVMATRRFIEDPGIILMCRSIKKAPSFGGSGLEKADFR